MERSLNPFAAEYAGKWLTGGVVIAPVDRDGKLLVTPEAWAQKDFEEVYDYFDRPPLSGPH